MRNITFTGTDLHISAFSLGTAQFGARVSRENAFAQLECYAQAGGNFIDTAHVYGDWGDNGPGISERLIGEWLSTTGRRKDVILSTKGGHPLLDSMHIPRITKQDIQKDLEGSLKNLRTDYIDLYFLHRSDPSVPVEEVLGWLEQARLAGKIRYYGCSNWHLTQVRAAEAIARAEGFPGFSCNQLMWSLADIRASALPDSTLVAMNRDFYAYHCQTGMNAMAYTSIANGYFTKLLSDMPIKAGSRSTYDTGSNVEIAALLRDALLDNNITPLAASLGYLMSQPFPTVPIASFNSCEQLSEVLTACNTALPNNLFAKLSKAKLFMV